MKKPNDTIGNRTRNLPVCSAVTQPTAPPRSPSKESSENKFFNFQSLSGDAEVTAAISVGIEHHIPWKRRQQRQLLYRVQW